MLCPRQTSHHHEHAWCLPYCPSARRSLSYAITVVPGSAGSRVAATMPGLPDKSWALRSARPWQSRGRNDVAQSHNLDVSLSQLLANGARNLDRIGRVTM